MLSLPLVFVLALVAFAFLAGIINGLRRFFTPQYTIRDIHFPLRIPDWTVYVALPVTAIGLFVLAAELIAGGGKKRARDTYGAWIASVGAAMFFGGWLGGIVSSYGLQWGTLWPVGPTPPAPPPPPVKK